MRRDSAPLGVPAGTLLVTALAAPSGGVVLALVNGVNRTIPIARDITAAVGDVLAVVRHGGTWLAIARYGTAATTGAEQDLPPDPNPPTRTGSLVVLPAYTGSFRDGRWRTDTDAIVQGVRGAYGNSTGAAFYGTKPATLSGATVTNALISLTREMSGPLTSTAGTLWLVTETERPTGAPTLTSSTSLPALAPGETSRDVAVPVAWAQAMLAGTAGGLAAYDADGSPWLSYAGRSAGGSFTLTIDWSR